MTGSAFNSIKNLNKEVNNLIAGELEFGYCVFCGCEIELYPKVPYCQNCYNTFDDITSSTEIHFCHICGKRHNKTFKYPAHRDCYYKTKKQLDY